MEEKIALNLFVLKSSFILIEIHNSDETSLSKSKIMKKADMTYSHTVKMIDEFEKHGLLRIKPKGRETLVELTIKGKKCAEHLLGLKNILEGY